MSFNHRHLWNTDFVKELLRQNRLSEAASFSYFLAIMAFDWLQFTLIAVTPNPHISAWSVSGSWATFAITFFGLIYLYSQNGGASGKEFCRRYFSMSVTVGWKFVAAMFLASWLLQATLAGQGNETQGWCITVAFALINVAMFWRLGFHLESLSLMKMMQASNPSFNGTPDGAR